jgi:AP-1 complex subunit gamma-1
VLFVVQVIVECLKDGDISIRKRALELVYALVNHDNVKALTKELLNYLIVADAESKADLCVKIAAIANQFAPNKRWHIDTLIHMLQVAGKELKRAHHLRTAQLTCTKRQFTRASS